MTAYYAWVVGVLLAIMAMEYSRPLVPASERPPVLLVACLALAWPITVLVVAIETYLRTRRPS